MFLGLSAIYYFYFLHERNQNLCTPDNPIKLTLMVVLKFLAITAWPFTIMAAYDRTWRSKDAGNVFLAAYLAANALFFQKTQCGFCVFAAAIQIIPYAFGALVAHGLGAWLHTRPK
jgi:hypothetical protein